jgi:endonuclease III
VATVPHRVAADRAANLRGAHARRPLSPTELVNQLGRRFSVALGIDLDSQRPAETFKWFLASVLLGARISSTVAERTYRTFQSERLVTPQAILSAGWQQLVDVLDRGGYARYDEKTATKLLGICRAVIDRCGGDLHAIERAARNPADLEQRIMELGSGIGPLTANIFLRELRGLWPKAEPKPSELVVRAARDLGFVPARVKDAERVLESLRAVWAADGGSGGDFPDFEAALVRHGIALRRRTRYSNRINSSAPAFSP